MIFLTIKWGDKYPAKYVNNLYKMVKRHYTKDFRFICYTDNKRGINKNVQVISIPDDGLLHPKYYFGKETFCFDRAKFLVFNSEEWLDCSEDDKFCFFDLDVVIQNNIDEIEYLAEKPRIINSLWQPNNQIDDRFFIETRGTFYNSSMMLWSYGQCRHIYYDVMENDEIVFKTFFKGTDNYHYWRQRNFWRNIPKDWVYSWNRGRYHPEDTERFKFRDDAKICLFNTDNVPHPSTKDHVNLADCKNKDIIKLWNLK
jgi:hypothetical protein